MKLSLQPMLIVGIKVVSGYGLRVSVLEEGMKRTLTRLSRRINSHQQDLTSSIGSDRHCSSRSGFNRNLWK